MTTVRVYGLRQCDACRKALKWLERQERGFEFRDLRETPVGPDRLRRWLKALGQEQLINRRSTTWRRLTEDERAGAALELLAAYPTLIKRPLVEWGGEITVGFSPDRWAAR